MAPCLFTQYIREVKGLIDYHGTPGKSVRNHGEHAHLGAPEEESDSETASSAEQSLNGKWGNGGSAWGYQNGGKAASSGLYSNTQSRQNGGLGNGEGWSNGGPGAKQNGSANGNGTSGHGPKPYLSVGSRGAFQPNGVRDGSDVGSP